MKKLLFIITVLCLALACNSDNDDNGNGNGNNNNGNSNEHPIKDLKFPEYTEPLEHGDTVTVLGEGFDTSSEIWFQAVTSKAETTESVKATIKSVTSSSIAFTVPPVYGKQSVILKQDGKEYTLGTLNLVEKTRRIAKVVKTEYAHNGNEVFEDIFQYDDDDNILKITGSFEDGQDTGQDMTNYTYETNKISRDYKNYNSSLVPDMVFLLGSNGLISEATDVRNNSGDKYYYTYNTKNQLIAVNSVGYAVEELIWENDNIVKITYKGGDAHFTYANHLNIANLDLAVYLGDFDVLQDYYLIGHGYMGKRNKNLLKEYSTSEYVFSYEYTLDVDGYVTEINQYFTSLGGSNNSKKLSGTYTITYLD
ncbi:IPT/TIG domain-containing protein [Odoribacter sp. OttesenSCG-928-A06]|nr:IPT/TIG domain-containing protein [Odoribacter sp. OttesenSCG-928-A06]